MYIMLEISLLVNNASDIEQNELIGLIAIWFGLKTCNRVFMKSNVIDCGWIFNPKVVTTTKCIYIILNSIKIVI